MIVPVSGEQVASAAALALRRNSGVGAIKDVRTRFYELPYCSALYPLVYHSSVIFVHDEQNAVEGSFGANGAELLQGRHFARRCRRTGTDEACFSAFLSPYAKKEVAFP